MKKLLFMSAMACLLLAGCSDNDDDGNDNGNGGGNDGGAGIVIDDGQKAAGPLCRPDGGEH